jgi:hypothetical protein
MLTDSDRDANNDSSAVAAREKLASWLHKRSTATWRRWTSRNEAP